ncbi:hypothetical protein LINPERPRIM_LOCUS4144 [Linum perenne]
MTGSCRILQQSLSSQSTGMKNALKHQQKMSFSPTNLSFRRTAADFEPQIFVSEKTGALDFLLLVGNGC